MRSIWITNFENNEIRIENSWINGEKLFVNNELQDDRLSFLSSNLTGNLINKNGEKLSIKANISGFFKVDCRLFVDNRKLELTQTK
ncbi:hypothetical protein [Flavobacterium sp. GT3R68]|uniref:hypothetical protein n=1 Tax=Flavobacterium sp. GT3R68 TaxID=2594437 RepID=UPI000F889EC4|nr:hypothetical protein [Flavobacterium sp. GT3R68]RTY89148.1 hypothetical protein EKL32_24305 [Flavobacterium sp. GSN2]TRW90055.1 hypothetical protein FNW07_11385 [Flavobacterium sp. GT3R68]